jgi:phosphatidylserine/phosphatidylglycerophosphate/cardiolipin synthase-like enzyme
MTIEFAHSNLWQKITSLAQKAKRRYAAVAYLGAGAFELLPLGSGDLLVVDLSLSSVRSGQTNPYEIEKYIRNEVEVHSRPNLHAKVFVFDKRAVISSANVSHNSQNNLVETAIITNDKEVVRAARGFVFSLRGEYVTPAYVKTCKREYQPHWSGKKANGDKSLRYGYREFDR